MWQEQVGWTAPQCLITFDQNFASAPERRMSHSNLNLKLKTKGKVRWGFDVKIVDAFLMIE